jgi:hypothetical protein
MRRESVIIIETNADDDASYVVDRAVGKSRGGITTRPRQQGSWLGDVLDLETATSKVMLVRQCFNNHCFL